MLYNYAPKPLPGPGTQNYAFEPAFSLPAYGEFGPATPYVCNAFSPFQVEQVYYNQAQYLQGLIGVVAGQIAHLPLIDTRGG